ncbi:hypothetical protein [Deinococcus aetherius]|nr:hypothetical protein [Deinococcus aetherius]
MYSDLLPQLQDSVIAMNKDVQDLRKLLVDLDHDEENKPPQHRWLN